MNNKTLAIVFGGLLLIYFLTKVLGGNRERSFDPNILTIDTARVSEIVVDPADDDSFKILKTGGTWLVERGTETYTAAASSVASLLSNVASIKAERVVTKNPDRYADYNVDDSSGTGIQLFSDGEKIGDVVVGRFNFNQATRSGISYFKKEGGPEIFAVDGFLSMTLSQGFDNYRDKDLFSVNTDDLTRFTWDEDGVSLIAQRADSIWVDDMGTVIDSASITSFISGLGMVRGATFINGQQDIGEKIKTLTMEGNNMVEGIEVNCYVSADSSHHFVIHSSANEEGYFFSDSTGIYDRLFGTVPTVSK